MKQPIRIDGKTILFYNFTELKVFGSTDKKLNVGDKMECRMDNGNIVTYKIKDLEYLDNKHFKAELH